MKIKFTSVILSIFISISINSAFADGNIEVVPASKVIWEQLNPARGDKSPLAGTLWGDRKGTVATGFLAKFVDGFSSPPHIHPETYRAVVISGHIHNDDPDAAKMWMPEGSFWTQPKGEVHITAAKGSNNIALVEIDKSPYLVRSFKDAYDSGEKPINVVPNNLVWVDFPKVSDSTNGIKIAYLWGNLEDGKSNGTFVKLPAAFKGNIHSLGETFRAVVVKRLLQYQGTEIKTLEPGSYFGTTKGEATHQVSSHEKNDTVLYIRTNGKFEIIPAQS